ncbi:MAG: PKD domain-containing protein [Candidatus Liptonbacteria bacterium]|nr:PKD domain-containing protein [Candidatus Liptonbacteria bacterium]
MLVGILMPSVSSAATVEELQALINSLVQQIAVLQAQIVAQGGGTVSGGGGSGNGGDGGGGGSDTSQFCTASFTRNLTIGSSGDDVVALRKILAREGFSVPDSNQGSDLDFTEYVAEAVSKLQNKLGILPASGYFGPATRWRMDLKYRCTQAPVTISGISPSSATSNDYIIITGANFANVSNDIRFSCGTYGTGTASGFPSADNKTITTRVVGRAVQSGMTIAYPVQCNVTVSNINGTSNEYPFLITEPTMVGTPNLPPVVNGVSGPTALKTDEIGTWTVNANDPENGTLNYSVDWGEPANDSGPYARISTTAPVQQTATFTHTYASAGTYAIKFKVTDNKSNVAQSSITVQVSNRTSTPSITVLSPSGGESFQVGDSVTTKWITTDIPENASIEISIGDTRTQQYSNVATANNVGSATWTIPEKLPGMTYPIGGGNLYKIAVFYRFTENTGVQGLSPAFTVNSSQPSINVLSPNGGEIFNIGETITIQYSSKIQSNARFYLTEYHITGEKAGNPNRSTFIGESASRVFPYLLTSDPFGTDPVSGTRYKIEVCLEGGSCRIGGDPTLVDSSDSYFTIAPDPVRYPGFNIQFSKTSYLPTEDITAIVSRGDGNTAPYLVDTYITSDQDVSMQKNVAIAQGTQITFRMDQQTSAYKGPGQYALLLCDSGKVCIGGVNTNSATFTIIAPTFSNTPPQIKISPTVPSNLKAGETATFQWEATDADNDDLSWSIDWGEGLVGISCGTNRRQTGAGWTHQTSHAWKNPGTYTVRVTVSEYCAGGTNSETFTITVGTSTPTYKILPESEKLPVAKIGSSYYQSLALMTNGVKTYGKMSVIKGSLPTGISLELSIPACATAGTCQGYSYVLKGRPTKSGSHQFVIEATIGQEVVYKEYTLDVVPPTIEKENQIRALYKQYLGREADPEGLNFWMGWPLESVKNGILSSPEYSERKANIGKLYKELLKRDVTASDFEKHYGQTIEQVRTAIMTGDEYRKSLITATGSDIQFSAVPVPARLASGSNVLYRFVASSEKGGTIDVSKLKFKVNPTSNVYAPYFSLYAYSNLETKAPANPSIRRGYAGVMNAEQKGEAFSFIPTYYAKSGIKVAAGGKVYFEIQGSVGEVFGPSADGACSITTDLEGLEAATLTNTCQATPTDRKMTVSLPNLSANRTVKQKTLLEFSAEVFDPSTAGGTLGFYITKTNGADWKTGASFRGSIGGANGKLRYPLKQQMGNNIGAFPTGTYYVAAEWKGAGGTLVSFSDPITVVAAQ